MNRIRGIDIDFYFPSQGKRTHFNPNETNDLKEKIRSQIDHNIWKLLAEETGLYDLMDEQAKDNFNCELEKNPPHVTNGNILATFERLESEKENIFERGLINVFKNLDCKYVSNDSFKVTKKIIISNYRGFSSKDSVRDIERINKIIARSAGYRVPEKNNNCI
ncbi:MULTISPECIES: DUF4942 domain-containing protein [Leptospira]|nr:MULTISPECIES: DUF4942 domain-containing protein [Leptospira]EMN93910.1 methyltransferase domain protein [Leptospira interrogans serovar Medanensis str. UT053]QCO35772.1 DUF4942 domain-containing protein [Leptospira interrogans]ULG82559.1 DUF4942 domain-containing protein [Leptospira interrogans]UML67435.1 DUF4942 domain-containing protein [Leptospira interrogans]UMQ52741.1 DUF4942 domain-containing protein [Leptospira interrogans]